MGWLPRIRIPIHGFVYLSGPELQIVDSQAFQRLRRIHQLALTSMVYPGATHTRFEHSLGVLHLATRAYDAILRNNPRIAGVWGNGLVNRNRQLLRLYALTHDLGHGPYSHVSDSLFSNKFSHEKFSSKIVRDTEIACIINQIGQEIGKEYGDKYGFTTEALIDLMEMKTRDPSHFLLQQIMDSELDVDKMDYLLRDSHYCGVGYGNYDLERLLDCLAAVPADTDTDAGASQNSEFRLAMREGGLHALEGFIMARYWMFVQVYYHRTRRLLDYYLEEFMQSILPNGHLPTEASEYLKWDDVRVWSQIEEQARHPNGNQWARLIHSRTIWKQVDKSNIHAKDVEQRLFHLLEAKLGEGFEAEQFRLDHRTKTPHELLDKSNLLLVSDDGATVYPIAEKSEIINKIAEPINTLRLYVRDDVFEKVYAYYKKLKKVVDAPI